MAFMKLLKRTSALRKVGSLSESGIKSEGECTDTGDRRSNAPKLPCRKMQFHQTGIPVKSNKVDVPNPKDVIEDALPNIETLSNRVLSMYIATAMGFAEDTGDIVTAVAMPVLMLESAVSTMNQIKKIGVEQREMDRKKLVLDILSIVLFVLPFAGEIVGAAFGGAAAVARVAVLIGEVSNIALTIESIIRAPVSAPLMILDLLVGPYEGASGRTSAQGFKEAAGFRRALSAEKLDLFGLEFKAQDAKIQRFVNACG